MNTLLSILKILSNRKRLQVLLMTIIIFLQIFVLSYYLDFLIKNAGATPPGWADDVRLTYDPADSTRPKIAIDLLDEGHVVWGDGRDGNGGVYYKKFNGTSWSSDLRLNSLSQSGLHPAIAIDFINQIHVVWAAGDPYEIYYSMYNGNIWSTPMPITVLSGYKTNWMPQIGPTIVIDSENCIYVFWTDATFPLSHDVAYVYYNGISWSSKQYVRNDPRTDWNHCNPDAIVDSMDNVHVAYVTTDPDGNYYINYKKFDGNSWSEEKQISDPIGICVNVPSITSDSINNTHIAWTDYRDDPIYGEIYYSKLDNEGNTLVNDLRLTDFPESSRYPCIEVDSQDNVHIVWFKGEYQGSYSKELYYTKLDNHGTTLIDDFYLSNGQYVTDSKLMNPSLSLDNYNRLHVVFGDDRDGNLEIYYKSTHKYDLSINAEDIHFSNPLPKNVENIFINATIYNNGGDLTNGTVYFYIDSIDGMNLIDSVFVSIPSKESDNVSVDWIAVVGTHTIWVKIESEDGIEESNLTNNVASKEILVNDPPTISIIAPSSGLVTVDNVYTISWLANDPDDDAEIQLFYDIDNIGNDGTLIGTSDQYPSGIVDSNGASQSYDWNTTILPDDSTWYIYAKIDDGVHAPVYSYSQGKIEIDHPNIPPIVDITSPSGGTVSGSITIQGTANDPDKDNIESVFVSIDNMVNWEITSGTTSWSWNWDTIDYSNGEHTIYAKAYDGEDSSEIVSITVTVDNGGNKAPLVSITYPSDGATVSGEIEIRGTASDYDGFVQLVELRIDDDPWIELSGTTNWNWNWDTTDYTNGEHTIRARARDDLGVYSQEKSIIVIVNNGGNILPSVQITSHSGGEVVSGEVKIRGTAVDHDGNVELVEVRIDDNNNWITVVGTTSWAYTWDTTTYSNGEHVVYARAGDDADEYSQIKSVTLIVSNGGNIPPVVNILLPASGTISGIVNIRGTASDLDGDDTITSVQVKIDDGWEYVDGTTDWSYNWDTTTLDDGNYTIYVRAYDDLDYSMLKSVTVYVDNPHKPTVTITTEMPKEISGTVTMRGNASDSDGEVIKVEIQIDDTEWEEVEGTIDWSYKLDTTKLSDGKHTIRIRVYDDEGELTVETINITVNNNSGRIFWLLLSVIMVLLVVFLIVGMTLRKRKTKSGIEPPKTQPFGQTGTQSLRCPQCNNVFETPQSSATIQCPYCGLSGTTK